MWFELRLFHPKFLERIKKVMYQSNKIGFTNIPE